MIFSHNQMPDDEAAILTLLINAGIATDEEHFSPMLRIKALQIAIETAMDVYK
jgi:hypothetical protein